MYLDIGKTVLSDLLLRAKVECGIAGIRDLRNNALDDRMESFVLSETLKVCRQPPIHGQLLIPNVQYLYLLFDEDNLLHNDDSNYVFTTEGHLLSLEQKYLKLPSPTVRRLRRAENQQCPAYEPPTFNGAGDMPGLHVGIRSRSDFDFARFLVSTALSDGDETWWHPNGWCTVPVLNPYVSHIYQCYPVISESTDPLRHTTSSSR